VRVANGPASTVIKLSGTTGAFDGLVSSPYRFSGQDAMTESGKRPHRVYVGGEPSRRLIHCGLEHRRL
jgi:hypothetical protein